jgi:hypothetical protein
VSRVDAVWLLVIGASRVDLGLCAADGRATALVSQAGIAQGDQVEGSEAFAAIAAAVTAVCKSVPSDASPKPGALRVLVSHRWLQAATLPWAGGWLRQNDGVAQARAQLRGDGFDIGEQDVLLVGQGAFGAPYAALAYPHSLMLCVEQAARELGASLRSVLDLASVAGHAVARANADSTDALAVRESSFAAFVRKSHAGWMLVQAEPIDQQTPIAAVWRRLALRDETLAALRPLRIVDLAGHEPDQQACVAVTAAEGVNAGVPLTLHLAAQALAQRSQTDAVSQRPRPKPWVAAAAAAVFALASWSVYGALEAASRLEARLSEAPTPRAQRVSEPAAAMTPTERARAVAVNAAVEELNLPVGTLLRAVQPPRDVAVSLLTVEVVAGSGAKDEAGRKLKLSAQANDAAHMTRYVAFLSSQPAFATAHLLRHEEETQDSDGARRQGRLRFSVDVVSKE